MPARVHAVIVARPTGRGVGVAHLTSALEAVAAQTTPVDAVTVVLCGSSPKLLDVINQHSPEGVIQAEAGIGFAAAVALASRRVADDASLWLLSQGTHPDPRALEQLTGILELAPSVAIVAPKLVHADEPDVIASMGVSMTRGGVSIELAADQYDQGQHDGRQDVLGSDIRGVLLRAERRSDLLPDPALAGADEGLDLGVRARLGGHRVAIAPAARVRVTFDGVAGMPRKRRASDRRRIAYATRVAQLHRRLTYAPAAAVPLHILALIPIVLWRTVRHLVAKAPAKIAPEWAATVVAMFRWGAIARSRSRMRGLRKQWKLVDQLRVSRAERAAIMISDAGPTEVARPDLRFFAGGGAWTVLASFVLSVVTVPMLLSARGVGGGGALPLRGSFTALWGDTGFGRLGYGIEQVGPADPFASLVALLGSFSPAAPSTALALLWLLAMPLATLGGWFAATRITERSGLRILVAVLWTLAPTFLSALIEPRPAALMAHLLLPWLVFAGLVVHRSWAAAGAASLLLLAVGATSPALAVLLVAVVAVALITAFAARRFTAAARLIFTVVPLLVWFAPLAWRQFTRGTPLALLADPGLPWQGTRAGTDLAGTLETAAGYADGSRGGIDAFAAWIGLGSSPLTWAPLMLILAAPVAVIALCAPFVRRWRVGAPLLITAGALIGAALFVRTVSVQFWHGEPVQIWPGALLSAGWLALILAAALALDAAFEVRARAVRRVLRPAAATAAALAGLLFAATAVPAVTSAMRGDELVTNGPSSTLPAYIAAAVDDSDVRGATLVLTILDDGSIAQRVVWGSSDTLGAQSTLVHTRDAADPGDARLAPVIADLVTPGTGNRDELSALGIRFVLIEPVTRTTGPASERFALASAAMDQNAALEAVGETGRGALWRLGESVAPRPEMAAADVATATVVITVEILIVLAGLLMAVPTSTSVRAARTKSRLVGERKADA